MDTRADADNLRGAFLPETGPFTPTQTVQVSNGEKAVPPVQLGVYRLLAKLGHGGMGTVYKAWHCRLKRPVALKVPSLDFRLDDAALARFHREMELIGRLDHPNIVRATDAGEAGGIPFLVMELVDGLDLRRLGQLLGPLPVPEACAIAYQTLLGLQCLWENGLVHRDIKPSNLMLTPAGEVKILDLGLGRYREADQGKELTATGLTMGTADYMAPEQRSDASRVDIRADIYSLGCTLYKLLAGKAPTETGEQARASANYAELAVSVELATVLRRLLAADKAERYATPAEAAEALRPFCEGGDLAGLFVRVGAAGPGQRVTPRPPQGHDKSTKPKPATSAEEGTTLTSSSAPVGAVPQRRIVRAAMAVLLLLAVAGPLLLGMYLWRNAASTGEAPVPPAAGDTDRRAAEWVLANGGALDVLFAGKDDFQPLRPPLPDAPFQVININLKNSTKVDDDGLKNLRGLAHLRSLSLHRAVKVSDNGLTHLAPLTSLQVLDLYHTNITDAGLESVGRLRQLQRLSLHETAITDAGLRHLRNLKELTALNVSSTQVSDRGLVHLTGLTKLAWLQLRNTAVTDEGVRHLRRLTALREIYLDPGNVSEKAAADLQASLPECKVMR